MSNLVKYNAARLALAEAQHATESIPSEAGVYAFYQYDQCMYVGESKNLRKRIATHERRAQLPGYLVRFFVCEDRKETEKWLIKEMKPLKNGRSPSYEAMLDDATIKHAKTPIDVRFDLVFDSLFGAAPFGAVA